MANDELRHSCFDPAVRWSGAVKGSCVWCDGGVPARHAPVVVDLAIRFARAIGCTPCAVFGTRGRAIVAGLKRTESTTTEVPEAPWNRS